MLTDTLLCMVLCIDSAADRHADVHVATVHGAAVHDAYFRRRVLDAGGRGCPRGKVADERRGLR